MSYSKKELFELYKSEVEKACEEIKFEHTYDGKLTQRLKEINSKYDKLGKELFGKEKGVTNAE